MLTREELDRLRAKIPDARDLLRLSETLRARAAPLLARPPHVPEVKAELSRSGGLCPNDGSALAFDPWSPEEHRCPRCGMRQSGERHYRNWARAQHLWLAERTAELALLGALGGEAEPLTRASLLLGRYADLYPGLPNRDNRLGPSHLFFSTDLESLWLTSDLAAAVLLREAGQLEDAVASGVDRVADEAAFLIGEFNEGLSNRQTWHTAALLAIAAWFDDHELAGQVVESRTGLLGHLADGFGADGLWWEGENYHLFALRGLMQGIHWARFLGFDLLEDREVQGHFRAALLGPSRSALPDFTYPARRDARYGVSLAQPASLELWEIGRAWLPEDDQLDAWLTALYALPSVPPGEHYDAWLHDAGRPAPGTRERSGLSWWALIAMRAEPPRALEWRPESSLLAGQGLAVLRHRDRYASLECGAAIGGHGHPDRLHLTFHAGGIPWLPDQGTGSYVHPTLAWYRSALAHNAPLLDGENAAGIDAWCEAFDVGDAWSWCRGRAGDLRRTLIASPDHLVDLVELEGLGTRALALPWHFQGDLELRTPGNWEPAPLDHPFVTDPERFVSGDATELELTVRPATGHPELRVTFLAPGAELLRATGPALPNTGERRPFLLLRATTERCAWVTLLDLAPAGSAAAVRGINPHADRVELLTEAGAVSYRVTPDGLEVQHAGGTERLSGLRRQPTAAPRRGSEPASEALAMAPRVSAPPSLDGSLRGFELQAPLELDSEEQYRRSEAPYEQQRFSACAWANWDGEALYLAVLVKKPELIFRPAGAPELELDNEPEDIDSDGLQVYLGEPATGWGFLLNPLDNGELYSRALNDSQAEVEIVGRWRPTSEGYLVTAAFHDARLRFRPPGARLPFDLLVNEMRPGYRRRAGQLVWSGGAGWVYLRGDRHDLSEAGTLELG